MLSVISVFFVMVLFVVGLGAAGFRDAVFFFTTAFVFLLVTAFVLGARTDFGAAGLAATRLLEWILTQVQRFF